MPVDKPRTFEQYIAEDAPLTKSPASTGISVPAMYIGQTDYVLTVSDELAESFDITASVDGRAIITGHDFRPPASAGNDPRDNPADLVSMFGAFLDAEIERADAIQWSTSWVDDDPFDGWTIHDSEADLSSLADACSLYGEDESAC